MMKTFKTAVIISFLSLNCFALETPQWQVDESELRAVIQELSSPQYKGRKSGTPEILKVQSFLSERFQKLGIEPLGENHRSYFQSVRSSFTQQEIGKNILGVIGSRNNECVLIGAHYDGQGTHGGKTLPSADDNASGIASLLAIAKNLKSHEAFLKKCVIIAAWDLEESGMKGSKYWVDHPTISLERIQLTLTFDLVGGNLLKQGAEKTVFVLGAKSSPFIDFSSSADLKVSKLSLEVIEPAGSKTARSDYAAFRDSGIPSVFMTTGTPWYYHSAEDSSDKINFPKLLQITKYSLERVWPYLLNSEQQFFSQNLYQMQLQETKDLQSLIEATLSFHGNSVEPEFHEHLRNDLKLFDLYTKNKLPARLCEKRRAFYNILSAVGGVTPRMGKIGKLISDCSFRE